MSNDEIETSEVYNHYLKLSKPTEEDFQRVFTDEELKKLCLKHPCRVDIWRWNVVNDYRILFTESGRFQRWSERKRLLMLAKAVNKMKPSVLYDEEEIQRTRKEEWGFQLKENILSLNYWERKKLRALLEEQELEPGPLLHVSDSEEIDEGIQSQCAVNTESMDMNEIYTQSQQQQMQSALEVNNIQTSTATEKTNTPALSTQSGEDNVAHTEEIDKEIQSLCDVNTESMNMNEIYTQTQPALDVNNVQTPTAVEKANTPALSPQSNEVNALLENLDEEDFLIDEDSDDSTETVLLQQQYAEAIVAKKPTETLQSQEVAPEIAEIYGVDTMSMTIDSQLSTQTQSMNMLKSQDVIPQDYENFRNIIPLTSTQSQSQVSEDIEVT